MADVPEYAETMMDKQRRGTRIVRPRRMLSPEEVIELQQQERLLQQQLMPPSQKKGFTKKWATLVIIVLLLLLDTSILSTHLFYSYNGNGSSSNNDTQQWLTNCQPIWPQGSLRRVLVCKFSEFDRLTNIRRQQFVLDAKRPRYDGLLSSLIRLRRHSNSTECEADENLIRILDVVLNGSGCLLTEGQFKDLVKQQPWIDLGLFARKAQDDDERTRSTSPVPPSEAAARIGQIEKEPGPAESASGQESTE
jgi:hypothetical protein